MPLSRSAPGDSAQKPEPAVTWYRDGGGFLLSATILLLVWGTVIAVVDPRGEFMVNDDWSFVRLLENIQAGKMTATGWGHGGPSAIVHVLWGGLFTQVAGFSLTNLRMAVLCLGVVGSLGLLALLRLSGAAWWLSLLGTLTVVLNPLFLSQSFTFMTDITFATLAIFSLLFLHRGAATARPLLIAVGLLFALGSILTRQIGIVLPAGFVAACLVHDKGRELGRLRMILFVTVIVLIPWILYEVFLYKVGSTPVTQHDVITNILRKPLEKGFFDYLNYLFSMVCLAQLGYLGLFLTPLLIVRVRDNCLIRSYRVFLTALCISFAVIEVAIVAGILRPPVLLHRNVIFDFGIGPILLKDTYLMEIRRGPTIPPALYYVFVFFAVYGGLTLLRDGVSFIRRFPWRGTHGDSSTEPFTTVLALACALSYLGIITFTGFHDRYLIPALIFLVVWLVAGPLGGAAFRWRLRDAIPGFLFIALLGGISVAGEHDFAAMKRRLTDAQQYVVHTLNVDPCRFDGGFEFNGYHCYRKNLKPREGLSWWWVEQEDYLLTLGPLPGYRVVRTFPFNRMLGEPGAVFVLQPEKEG